MVEIKMSWEDILKVGGEEYTRDDKGMITSTKRYMHRYSSDDAFVGGGYDKIIPFSQKREEIKVYILQILKSKHKK